MALAENSSSEKGSSSETKGTTRENGSLVEERLQIENEPSGGTSQDVVVINMSRGPAYHFTAEERRIVPCWSDYELLTDIVLVVLSEESSYTSLHELAPLTSALLKKKARSLQYVSRRTNRSKRLSVRGNRLELVARILTWQHVRNSGCFLFISRE